MGESERNFIEGRNNSFNNEDPNPKNVSNLGKNAALQKTGSKLGDNKSGDRDKGALGVPINGRRPSSARIVKPQVIKKDASVKNVPQLAQKAKPR